MKIETQMKSNISLDCDIYFHGNNIFVSSNYFDYSKEGQEVMMDEYSKEDNYVYSVAYFFKTKTLSKNFFCFIDDCFLITSLKKNNFVKRI